MNDSHIVSIAQIKEFLKLNDSIQFKSVSTNQTDCQEEEVWQDLV